MTRSIVVSFLLISLSCSTAHAITAMKIRELCRIKGQETNTLQGVGLVVGLQGTGDGKDQATQRSIAKTMQRLGVSIPMNESGQLDLKGVGDYKNVAMVIVTATVPGVGAQQGDLIDVNVSALSAKSLAGGRLLPTPLLGPNPASRDVYAMSQGQIRIPADGSPTAGTIQGGAKVETTIRASFVKDGWVTLVLDRDFASFELTSRIASAIKSQSASTSFNDSDFDRPITNVDSQAQPRALDQLHVQFPIPPEYLSDPIKYITDILEISVPVTGNSKRVVIDERAGIVVIGKDVEIAPGLVTHGALTIEAGGDGFAQIGDRNDEVVNAKLANLSAALKSLNVPVGDMIEIIKTLKAKGDLYGEVVFR